MRQKSVSFLARGLAVALAVMAAHALAVDSSMHQRYRWKNADGVVEFSDTLPLEAIKLGYDVVDASGAVVRHVDRAKTAEERKADAAAAAAEAETRQREDNVRKADQQLLIAYATEADLIAAQQARLTSIDQTIQNVKASQADQEKALTEQLAHASNLESDGQPVPASVKQQIDTLKKNIADQTAYIDRRQEERKTTEEKSAAELAHYRELKSKKADAAAQ